MSARTPVLWNDHVAPKLRFGEDWLLGAKRATYGLAVVRILFGLTALGFLAANWLNRHYLWGDAARWLEPIDDNGGFSWPFTFFRGGSSQLELDLKLGLVAVLLVLLVLGWRTRILAPIILILWVSLIEAQPIYGDQSDNIFRILFFYMCFADTSGRWSLDARRRAKQAAGQWHSPINVRVSPELRANSSMVAIVFHNLAVLAIGVQVCLIYLASGLYKVQGELWQDGTAVYYPMQVGQYAPWPALNEFLGSSALGVMVITYFSVFIQIFFPLMLLRRTTRVIALMGVAAMHLGIAVIMGLPFFSLFILAGDMIFIRDSTYVSIQRWGRRRWQERRARRGAARLAAQAEEQPAQAPVATGVPTR
ncbi:HTTM domain-containing protein [Phytoactinopolyspora limicola]|uniref:HTTM domain-containing protein n=1 Tax=Phytoactinopolyspora limicola TaxID=2715536 RepID=UPI00140BFBDC|nr:HTTM domain-containing protein [Phytoactinopolyspora limicola]